MGGGLGGGGRVRGWGRVWGGEGEGVGVRGGGANTLLNKLIAMWVFRSNTGSQATVSLTN